MESGGSSNEKNKNSTRATQPGIVIRDLNTAATDVPTDVDVIDLNPEQTSFKRDPDQYMPIANVIRIMRRVLPAHAKIADDAKETIQECVSEFISFITSEANERCHREYRKTITSEDVLAAVGSLGFDNYVEPLSLFLNKYRAQDPERGSSTQMSFVRRSASFAQLQPSAQVRKAAPPPPPTIRYPPAMSGNYSELPQMNQYFAGNRRGGEGSSRASSMEFGQFRHFK